MKKNTHLYSYTGDYAPVHSSEPIWKLALKEVAVYTLLVVALIVAGRLIITYVEFMYQ